MRTRTTRPEYPWNADRSVQQILPYLYQAGEEILDDEEFLKNHNIAYILSVTTTITPEMNDKRFEYCMHIKVEDDKSAEIATHFKSAIEFITYARTENKAVVVHCQQGVSRSGAVILAYLIFQLKATLYQAWHYVEGICKKHVDPNLGFQKQLLEFQSSTHNYELKDLEKQYVNNEKFKILREHDEKYIVDKEENYLKLCIDNFYVKAEQENINIDEGTESKLNEYLNVNLKALDINKYHFNLDPAKYNPKLQKLMKQKLQLINIQEKIDVEIAKQMSKL